MYGSWGIENRRAPSMIQTTANTNFSLLGFSSGVDLFYSSDQSQFRQNLNTISFNATWRWLTIQAGDVNPNFSKYGINGATIRGGYIKIAPKNWRLELSGGRSREKVENSTNEAFREPSFQRWTMTGKVGYETDNNHYYLSSHYSVDKSESIEDPGPITPQENLTITPDVQVTFLDQAITLAFQATASAFTRDLNSPHIPAAAVGVPSFLGSVIQAHTSSRLNYAGEISTSLDLDSFGLELGYERIQPGYTSLGLGRIRDDQHQIRIGPSVQLFKDRLLLQGTVTLGRDNLSGSRLETQKNTAVGTNASFQLTDKIFINGNYSLLVNDVSSNATESDSPATVTGQEQVAHTFMLQPSITFQKNETTHNISLTGSYYTLTNRFEGVSNAGIQRINSDTYSSSANYNITFTSGFSLNVMGNFVQNTSNFSKNTSVGANIGANYFFFDRKLTVNFNGGINQNKNEATGAGHNMTTKARQLMFNVTGNYQLTEKDSFSLSIRNRNNTVFQPSANTYSELEGSLNYQHRF